MLARLLGQPVGLEPAGAGLWYARARGVVLVLATPRGESRAAVADAASQAVGESRRRTVRGLAVVALRRATHVSVDIAARAGAGHVDLAGNAHVAGPTLHVHVEGRRLAPRAPGRPPFRLEGPAGAVVRALLVGEPRVRTQRALADVTGVDGARVSRTLAQLEEHSYLEPTRPRTFELRHRELLLAELLESPPLAVLPALRGRIASLDRARAARHLHELLHDERIDHAFTGHAALGPRAPTNAHSLSVYAASMPSEGGLALLGFRADRDGDVRIAQSKLHARPVRWDPLPCVDDVLAHVDAGHEASSSEIAPVATSTVLEALHRGLPRRSE